MTARAGGWPRWWLRRSAAARLLLPLAVLFAAASGLRRRAWQSGWLRPWRAPVPVIIVGNVTAGGSGKTPLVAYLAQALREAGWHPGIVSRGYGRRRADAQPLAVQADSTPEQVGDEPLLLHRISGCPVWVAARRAQAAQCLLRAHPRVDVLLGDDGLQHFALARDLQMVVVDGRGRGNGWPLPAGPLREPWGRPRDATLGPPLARADSPEPFFELRRSPAGMRNLADGRLVQTAEFLQRYAAEGVSAAAAIGDPGQFFDMLRAAGLSLRHTATAPDHRALPAEMLARLPGQILLTEKDALKCRAGQPGFERLWAVPLRLEVDPALLAWLLSRLRRDQSRSSDGFTPA